MAPEPKKSRKRAAKPVASKSQGSVEPTSGPSQTENSESTERTKPAVKRSAKKAVAVVPTEEQVPAKAKKATDRKSVV